MDQAERNRYKQLANDAIIDLFGSESREQKLAEALESAIGELEYIADECDHCKYCDIHGVVEDDEIPIDAGEVLRIHGELKKQIQALKDLHVKFSDAITESDVDDLVEELESQIVEVQGYVDELEAEVLP